jgi:Flp pilus assembly protein TadG
MSRATRQERGTVMVESAVTLMLFLSLAFGVIGLGWAVYVYNQVSELAREATRYAIVHGASGPNPPGPVTATDIRNFVLSRASGLNPSDLSVTSTWTPNNYPGSVVKVQVQYSLSPFVPLIPPQVLTLQSTSQMVISQ